MYPFWSRRCVSYYTPSGCPPPPAVGAGAEGGPQLQWVDFRPTVLLLLLLPLPPTRVTSTLFPPPRWPTILHNLHQGPCHRAILTLLLFEVPGPVFRPAEPLKAVPLARVLGLYSFLLGDKRCQLC